MKATASRAPTQRDSPLVPLEAPPRLVRLGSASLFMPIDTRRSFSPLCFNTPPSTSDDWLVASDTTPSLAKAAVLGAAVNEGRRTPSSLAQRVSSPMRARGSKSLLLNENENHGNTAPRGLQEMDDEKENKRGRSIRLPHKKKAKSGPRSKLVPTEPESEPPLMIDELNTKMPASVVMEELELELASFPPATPLPLPEHHRKVSPRPFLFTPLREAGLSPAPIVTQVVPPQPQRRQARAMHKASMSADENVMPIPQQHGCIFTGPHDMHPTRLLAPCLAAAAPAACHIGGEPVPFRPPVPYAPFFAAAYFGQGDVPACAAIPLPAGYPHVLRPEPVRAEQEQQEHMAEEQQDQVVENHHHPVEEEGAAAEMEQHQEEENEEVNAFHAATVAPGSAVLAHGAAMI